MVLLVGADRLGNIEALLRQRGYGEQVHVTGRNARAQRRWSGKLKKARLMVLFTDFVGHNVMRAYRRLAKEHGVPVVACRRSTVSLVEALDRLDGSNACAGCRRCPR